ncbi:GDSL esterase/lipase At2g30310-like [Juglans microcarpa x Juglans regia]|uniref:GDSL esterase/lipase At2g30310-like n=1 Tax=Juglans microcarpa x Juglans regia TaxID=2249226 RepID=UPI001B7E9A9D|nr:GDSL esterase/lipase At2g30310-like [Juglans microcarpa x Juglans regia]
MAKLSALIFLIIPGVVLKYMIWSAIISNTAWACTATKLTTSPKFPAFLIFGDSTVDDGNNNYIRTFIKGNHYPYGRDFPDHIPTGRFSNGKLVSDFIASALRIKENIVPAFLDPNLSDEELRTGVSFASAGAGYDDLTTVASGAISMSKQIEYFKKYLVRLKGIVGEADAKKIVNGSLFLISAGANDFIFNFYDLPTRRLQFNISGYHEFLQNRIQIFIEDLYNLGCRKLCITGLPPIGCLPIQMTAKFENPKDRKCLEDENLDAENYNQKLAKLLPQVQAYLPGSKIVYADVYEPLIHMTNHPEKYGLVETKRGCCGTGLIEVGPLCTPITPICKKASEYLFWDSIHPSETAYQYLSKYIMKRVLPKLLYI